MNDIQKLESLLNWRKKYNFSFTFKELSAIENNNWYNKITKNYKACGCNTGKIFTMVSLVIIFTYYIIQFKQNNISPYNSFYLYAFIFLVFFSLLGKMIGKMIAYKHLKNDINELKQLIITRRI